MVQGCPFSTVTNLDRREENGMEIDIVLAHELEQSDIGVIKPPSFPFLSIVGGDTDISDTGLELCLGV